MPPTLDREAVERALKWHGISLADLLPVWCVQVLDRWPEHPLVADFLALTAAQIVQRRHQHAGKSATAALRDACRELGLQFETVRSRLRAGRTAYLRAHERCSKSGGNPTEIVEKAS